MDNAQKENVMGTKSIGSLLLSFSIPAILGMIIVALNQIISSIYIGQGVGPLALAAMAVTFPVINLLIAFSQLIAVGCAALCSIELGKKDMDKAHSMLGHSVLLEIIVSVVFSYAFWAVLDPMLIFFGASEETLDYAREYMVPLLVTSPIVFVMIGLNFFTRSTGYPKTAMVTALMTTVGILLFSPLFIYEWGWGMEGAALAVVSGQLISLVWLVVHFLRPTTLVRFKRGIWRLRSSYVKDIVAIGMAPFLVNFCACIVVIVINRALMEYGGDLAIGAFGIVNRLLMLFALGLIGLGQGMQPIIGYNFGARNKARVRKALWYGMAAGTSIAFVGMLSFLLCPRLMVLMFTDHEPLVEITTHAMMITGCMFIFVGPGIIIGTYFQAIGMAKLASLMSTTRQMICLVPALIVFPLFWGLDGVWWSLPFSDIMGAVVGAALLYMTNKADDNDCQEGDPECTPPPDFFKPKPM
ncbi:MAG: MATE family efflux transporter [Mailhella sp.]|nr:MATE family efflux transporter [Mailhella sp.]